VSGAVGTALGVLRRVLGHRVAPALSIAVAAGAAALLLAAVGLHVARLLEESAEAVRGDDTAVPSITGALSELDHGWAVAVEGPPGAAVLVISAGRPVTVVVVDRAGHGTASGLDLGAEPKVELVPLGAVAATLSAGEAATAPTATATATATAPPTRVPSPTAPAPPPRVSSSPSPSPTAAPSRASRPIPSSRPLSREESRVRRSAPPVLHLVADAGPYIVTGALLDPIANGTAELLDLLAELDLQVTMFLTGRFIEKHPGLVRRVLLEGHEIGNHTFSHPHLTSYAEDRTHRLLDHVSREWFEDELLRTEKAFHEATGQGMSPLWRAPYGEENATLRGWAAELGYLHVRWSSLRGASLDSWDWVNDEHSRLYQDSRRMVERLLAFPRLHGGIVLMHLASDREEPPWDALPEFVRRLRDRRIEPIRVTDLVQLSPIWRPWLEQADKRHRRMVENRIR